VCRYTKSNDNEGRGRVVSATGERGSERQASALLESLPGMAYRVRASAPWPLLFVSEGVVGLTGVTARALASRPSTWLDVVHPEDAAALEAEAAAALSQRRGFSLVHRVLHASGEVRWVMDRCQLVQDGEGEPMAFDGFASDVTELQREEERLREREASVRGIFDKAAVGLAHVRLSDGRWQHVNEHLCEMFGYRREELLALTFQDMTHPADLGLDLEQLERLLRGEIPRYSMEKRYFRKDGSVFWANLSATVFRGPTNEPEYGIAVVEDISERKRVEAALLEQEERLHLAQAAGGVGIFDWDLLTRELRWSEPLFRVFGRTPRASGQVSLDEILSWLHPEDRLRVLRETEASIEAREDPLISEYRVLGEDGELRWVHSRGEVRRDAAGAPVRVLGAIRDITPRKLAEEGLRRASDSLAIAQRAGNAGLWDWAIKEGPVSFASPEYRDLYGLAEDQPVTYELWLDLIYEEDRERVEAYGREVFAQGSEYYTDFRFEHPTRGLRWIRSRGLLYRDDEGRPERFSGVNLDITALKRTEQALHESEKRLRKVIDSMFAFVWVLAPDGTLTEANRAPVEAAGLTREELVGRKFWDCSWWSYDDEVKARLQAAFHRAVRGEVLRYDETIRIANDGRITIDFMLQPVFEGGRLQLLIPSAVDVTDRTRAEEALREADRRKDDFLATLAHELRNPLAPLRTGFEVMKRSSERATRERVREMMERQLGHMVRLIDDLLDVSRIGRGKVALKRERVTLKVVLAHAVETSQPLLDAGQHTLSIHLPDEPVFVDGDLIRLAQVLSNLLNNAAKYTPKGGRVDLAVSVEGGQAVLRVSDNGVGISAEALPNVFDLFEQLPEARGRGQGGLGIGLSLARGLVELHGGTIRAESPGLGRGSTFTVRLPLALGAGREEEQRRASGTRALGTRTRVLVVDDNEDAAEMLATVLRLEGHDARTALDRSNALAAAKEFHPEVVFLDIGMPGMSGHEFAEELRVDPALAGTLLVALTGWGAEEDRRRSKDAGFDFHLTKPVDLDQVQMVLDARRK
jgi:PAS domain S-box-containing protein